MTALLLDRFHYPHPPISRQVYMNNPSEQRQGMIAYNLSMIRKYEGRDDDARALFEESKRLWPENLNAWIELEF